MQRHMRGLQEDPTASPRLHTVTVPQLRAGSQYTVRIACGEEKRFAQVALPATQPGDDVGPHTQPFEKGHSTEEEKGSPEKKGKADRLVRGNPGLLEMQIDKEMEGNIIRVRSAFPGLAKGALRKVGAGAYQVGSKKISLSILNEQLMVRVGGGFQSWNEFIDSHYSYLRSYIVPCGAVQKSARANIMSRAQTNSVYAPF